MKICDFNEIEEQFTLYPKDDNGREITLYHLNNVVITGDSEFYPNILLYPINQPEEVFFNPIKEQTLSLQNHDSIEFGGIDLESEYFDQGKIYTGDVFYFIYNTENYYHFVYDTIPYLISYLESKRLIPDLKLLMNSPSESSPFMYKFVKEFLFQFGIVDSDIIKLEPKTIYTSILISTSYTHDFDSNLPPREEIYRLFQEMASLTSKKYLNLDPLCLDMPAFEPPKIYISRRSWVHGDTSNIGTNYTTRRQMVNEDELVEYLKSKGYVEVFTELLSVEQTINLFHNATHVIGAIGGGLVNVLFSKPDCKLTVIESPTFFNVNKRFLHSFKNVNYTIFDKTKWTEEGEFKTNMRVKTPQICGEIIKVFDDEIEIIYSDTKVVGWNANSEYKSAIVKKSDCVRLDEGLNSPWLVDLEEFKKLEI